MANCLILPVLVGTRHLSISLLLYALAVPVWGATNTPVLFNRDIRPILSDNCFPCHGFDAAARKAGLRLDTAEGLVQVKDGRQPVKPGDTAASEIWRRVTSKDPKVMMPPPESGKRLEANHLELLNRWIKEGGAFQKHWSFEPPTRPTPPAVPHTNWIRNDIDRFVLATLLNKKLSPSAEAPPEKLIRRLSLDLTGLPPDPAEVEGFVQDHPGTNSFENAVDRLLNSPRYGEHMARYWLDVARYGDTHGLHLDNERAMWPYRDWVVSAFNSNLPFDQFTIWQLAGDLLPNATREQLLASGFNRCNVSTSEGGAIEEEFQVRYAVDRVETTAAAWMGLTMGCAVCHDHKLDPISQKEFYEVFSIFNNISEQAMDGNALLPPPILQLPTPIQETKMAELDAPIGELQTKLKNTVAELNYIDPATLTNTVEPKEVIWLEDDLPEKSEPVGHTREALPWVKKEGPSTSVHSGERALKLSGKGLLQVGFTNATPLEIAAGDKVFAHVYLSSEEVPRAVMIQLYTSEGERRANWGDADAIGSANEKLKEKFQAGSLPDTNRWVRLEVEFAKLGLRPGTKLKGLTFIQLDGTASWDAAGQLVVNDPAQHPDLSLVAWEQFETQLKDKSSLPGEIKELLKKEQAKRTDDDKKKLKEHFLSWIYTGADTGLPDIRKELKAFREKRAALDKEIVATMISRELDKPRPAWVLLRGEYDKHGEPVRPGVPSILPPLPSGDTTNRLTFARWLVDPQHPLTARVTVNRLWQQFFGTGLVKTAEDFGTKGEWPSHPELLDWLATEFMRSGWDVKHMVRLIVSSGTYRQDSKVSRELWKADPENRLLARGPRLRLDAEVIRDSALQVSRLLKLTMGGRGVRPYQPAGIWEAVGYTTSNTAKYSQDKEDALYRRSLYIFWKRTAPPPSMTTFDAPSREQCRARRERTNTPLQALLTMNDVLYFEAARNLGYRILKQGGEEADRLRYGFKLVTSRQPGTDELAILSEALTAQRARYSADTEAAKKLLAVGESPVPNDVPAPELAAYTMVANVLLNLDETLTKN